MQNQQTHTLRQEAQPLVSFIITYYDLPVPMLCKCIDSILALALAPREREIIIIDDGSKVSPMNGLMHYGDDIIYVRQKNGGLSMARNKGIEVATGRYIQFVDADDYLLQAPYDYCLGVVRSHQDADMVLFDFTSSQREHQTAFHVRQPLSGTEHLHRHNIHGTAWGYLFRAHTLSELRFTPGIWHEDEEFTPQLFIRAEHVYATDAKAYFYTQRQGSITTSKDVESRQKRFSDMKGVIVRLQRLGDRLPQHERVAMQRRTAQLTMDYIYNTIVQTRSRQQLNQCLDELAAEGLFPLPNHDYSSKYTWFRRMTTSSLGRSVLLSVLPLMKKER